MPFVEVFVPRGSLTDAHRKAISERLVGEVMVAEGAPDTPAARSISWLVLHEIDTWSVGGTPVASDEPPRYLVRVGVPAGSLVDEPDKRARIIERVTAVLAESDDDADRLLTTPAAWVHVHEVPEGNWGAAGRVVAFPDIARFIEHGAVRQPA